MKKICFALLGLCVAGNAVAAPSHVTRQNDGSYRVTYDYKDRERAGWYLGARAELSFLNWTNKYTITDQTDGGAIHPEDKFDFETMFGGAVSVGHRLGYHWRIDGELGYIGSFEDQDTGSTGTARFRMSIPYLTANAYYEFISTGIYLGVGAGVAVPTTKIEFPAFQTGKFDKTSVSPMGSLMLGWAYKLTDDVVLDLRYRLAMLGGTSQKRGWTQTTDDGIFTAGNKYSFENKIGMIMDNSISVGLRYEF